MIRLVKVVVASVIVVAQVGAEPSRVTVKKMDSGWKLLVNGKPYLVKGICYSPTNVGESPDEGTWRDWMVVDDDRDGRTDAAYQSWVDVNRNNQKDPDEKEIGDFGLLQQMGANTIRVYHHPSSDPAVQKALAGMPAAIQHNHAPNKQLLRDLFKKYGIRVAMGDFLGAYAVGSGASWDPGTDYTDATQRKNMMRSVEAMVKDFRDEPYLLFYVLGNENNYRMTHTNANQATVEYAKFVNQVVRRIHELDPHHPVVLCNGETQQIRTYAKYAPDVDILGINSYRQPGFGTLWKEVSREYDKPVVMMEFGTGQPRVVQGVLDEKYQESIHRAAWCDIAKNGIGGFAFTWVDQWWHGGNPFSHDVGGQNHEWHGLWGQGDGQSTPLLREPRKVFAMYERLWNGREQCAEK